MAYALRTVHQRANTVYTPDGLMGPTDLSFPLRNLIERKADALYGRFCNLLPAPWSIRPQAEKTWSVEAFGWSEPVGGTEHVEPFLSYRNGRMEDLRKRPAKAAAHCVQAAASMAALFQSQGSASVG